MFYHAPKGQLIFLRRRKHLQELEILHLWRNFKDHFAVGLPKVLVWFYGPQGLPPKYPLRRHDTPWQFL